MSEETSKENRSTSAAYRLPAKPRPRSTAARPTAGSDLSPSRGRGHHAMTDKSSQATMPADNIRGFDRRSGIRSAAFSSDVIDPVMQDRVWTQTLLDERRRNKIWDTQWGFTAQYDQLGRLKPLKEIEDCDTPSIYSNTIPNTNSAIYGSRLPTTPAARLQSLEFRFYSENRRRRLGTDFVAF